MISQVKQEAARDAAKLLAKVWNNPLPIAPDIVALRMGVTVRLEALGERTDGVLLGGDAGASTIALNEANSEVRRRFTCAHELGHYVRRSANGQGGMSYDPRNPNSLTGDDPEEVYANEFAACLLMPESLVRTFHFKGFSDLEMARKFAVSRQAMRIRLVNLGLAG